MAIQLRCPHCGTKIEVMEKFAGRYANCPACWDPVRVPYVSVLDAVASSQGQQPPSPPPLEPVSGLVVSALKTAILHPSRYFVYGLLICLGCMFVFCGGLGMVKNLISPAADTNVVPKDTEYDEPSRLREMSSDLDELQPKDVPKQRKK
jgi:hypothetical protein